MLPRKIRPLPNERLITLLRKLIVPDGYIVADANEFFREAYLTVETYPMELQEALVPLLENDEDKKHYSFLAECIEEERSPVLPNEYVAYHQHLTKGHDSFFLLGGLRFYPQLPKLDDYSKADAETRDKVTALLTVAMMLNAEGSRRHELKLRASRHDHGLPLGITDTRYVAHGLKRAMVITSEPLAQLIMDNPCKAPQIAETIIERNTADVEIIDSIINSSAPAVGEGRL